MPVISSDSITQARTLFPRGLAQPSKSFRSSVDALLLASFVADICPLRFMDLGTGCGMAACALALRLAHAVGVGVDIQPEAVEAAMRNAASLGIADRISMQEADVADIFTLTTPFDVVLANPPYRRAGAGRTSPEVARQQALCEGSITFDHFCATAYALLRHHGYFCCIYPAQRLREALQSLHKHRLGARRLLCVHTRPSKAAHWVLIEARKDSADDLCIEPALTLYAAEKGEEFTRNAKMFCGYL